MYGDWSSLLLELLGIVLAGLTIKLMDDHLDVEFDQCIGRQTLALRLGRACLPYGLCALVLAMAIAPQVVLTLFLAAYAIGMGHDLREKMPTCGLVISSSAISRGSPVTMWSISRGRPASYRSCAK